MFKTVQLIFAPMRTWTAIDAAQRSILWVFFVFWLPWMLLSSGAEYRALIKVGDRVGQFNMIAPVASDLALKYWIVQLIGLTTTLVAGTWIVKTITEGLHQTTTWRQTFTLVAYAMGPLFLGRLLDCFTFLDTWVCWGIAAILLVKVMYEGVGIIMKPEITKGFSLFIVASAFMFILSALAHFAAFATLHHIGKF